MLDLLNTLSKNELTAFSKFLHQSYYNQSEKTIRLFRFLKSKLKAKELEEPSRKEIFKAVFGKEKYNDGKCRKLISEFTGLFKRFLSITGFESKSYLKEITLLEEFDTKRIDRLLEPVAKNLLEKLKGCISRDDEYYSASVELYNLLGYYYYGKDPGKAAEFLHAESSNIDLGFMFRKLHSFRSMILYNELHSNKKEFNFSFYNEIIAYIQRNKLTIKKDHPNIYFIFLNILMYSNKGDRYADEFLKYLNIRRNDFPREKLTYYYTYITSFYWMKINAGRDEYKKSLLKVYKEMVNQDLLLIDKYLHDSAFNSVVIIGISQKEFGWTENFIEKYGNKIEPSMAKDAVKLSYAKILFHKKRYDEAVNHLNNIGFKNTLYFTNSKFLLAKIYYEEGEFTPLNYILDSLNHYKSRNKDLLPGNILTIKIFIKYMRELIRYKEEKKKNAVIIRKEMDNENSFIPERNWFYEKINELGE